MWVGEQLLGEGCVELSQGSKSTGVLFQIPDGIQMLDRAGGRVGGLKEVTHRVNSAVTRVKKMEELCKEHVAIFNRFGTPLLVTSLSPRICSSHSDSSICFLQ